MRLYLTAELGHNKNLQKNPLKTKTKQCNDVQSASWFKKRNGKDVRYITTYKFKGYIYGRKSCRDFLQMHHHLT